MKHFGLHWSKENHGLVGVGRTQTPTTLTNPYIGDDRVRFRHLNMRILGHD